MRSMAAFLLVALLLSFPATGRAQILFTEDFSDNLAGWTLGPEWAIGSAVAGPTPPRGFPDPASDYSPSADNGVAGTVIGGNYSTAATHFEYSLVSPNINTVVSGQLMLSFRRWLNIDYPPFARAQVEVSPNGGATWTQLYVNPTGGPEVTDSAWMLQQFNVTPYKSATFRVRFSFAILRTDAYVMSGWNVDDVKVWSPCSTDADADGHIAVTCDGDDCNDADPSIHPGATEACDAIDSDCDGALNETCLTIQSVLDVSGDQGRNVRLTWVRAFGDVTGGANTSYSVWRRIAPGLATSRVGIASVKPADLTPQAVEDLPPGQWDFLTWAPAIGEPLYHYVAPTLCDANANGTCWSVFLIRAHQANGSYEDAPVDSGYSVDNLVPPPPAGAQVQFTTGGAALLWAECPAPDFQQFHIYRGSDPSFVPSPANRVHTTSGTSWSDAAGVAGHVYKLTATDFNGNESGPVTALGTTAVDGTIPSRTGLSGVAPNPASSRLSIAFDLAAAADVRLEVIDMAGRRVRTLVSGLQTPGRYTVAWDARHERGTLVSAGIYMIRLMAAGRIETRRVAITH